MYGNSLYNFYNSSLELKLFQNKTFTNIHVHQSLQTCRKILEILRFISLEFQKEGGQFSEEKNIWGKIAENPQIWWKIQEAQKISLWDIIFKLLKAKMKKILEGSQRKKKSTSIERERLQFE